MVVEGVRVALQAEYNARGYGGGGEPGRRDAPVELREPVQLATSLVASYRSARVFFPEADAPPAVPLAPLDLAELVRALAAEKDANALFSNAETASMGIDVG